MIKTMITYLIILSINNLIIIVRAMIADQSGDLWIGTWNGGLNQYDREKDAFIRYQNDPENPHSLSNNIIRTIYEDRDGTIWAGTMGGLNKLDRESGKFTRYRHDPDDPNSLSHNTVWSVVEDSTGVLWVGTEGGLNRFDPQTEQFVHHRHMHIHHDTPAFAVHCIVQWWKQVGLKRYPGRNKLLILVDAGGSNG